ncbi:MAG: hypothetical protein Ct9H300mP19_15190 [Dehalococcoidia bacterium]|nr:MAG: hypothetical protein Ct9H300mP19_15190 [Dehalococcoidia bacterium]
MVMDDLDLVPQIEELSLELDGLRIVIDHCLMLNSTRKTESTLNCMKKLSPLSPNPVRQIDQRNSRLGTSVPA